MSTTLLSSAQCAARLGLSKQTVISLAKSGAIPASFISRRWKVREQDLEAFVLSQQRRGR